MKNIPVSIILMIGACASIVFRKKLAQNAVDFQNERFGFRFGAKEVKINTLIYISLGLILACLSILSAIGIFEFK